MKTGRKYTWLVLTIVVLVLMNITTIITVIYNRNQAKKEEVTSESNMNKVEASSIRYSGRYFRDKLNFNSEQTTMFVELNPIFRKNVRNINNDLNLLRQQMLYEMAAENCDTTRLNTLSDSIGCLHADLKKVTYKYYLAIKNICDQKQQEKLEQLFGEMFASDSQMRQYGKGGQQGRRRGRQFNN